MDNKASLELIEELKNKIKILEKENFGYKKKLEVVSELANREKQKAALSIDEIVKYKAVFDILHVGITITDEEGKIVDCNRASEVLLGISKEEHFIGKEWDTIRPDGSTMPNEENAGVRALKEKKPIRNVEMGIVKPNGTSWFSVTSIPMNLPDFGVLIAYFDITECKRNEHQQLLFIKKFEALLDQVTDYISFKDINGKFQFCSQSVAKMAGFCHWKDVIGKEVSDLFKDERSQIYTKDDQIVLEQNTPIIGKVNPYKYEDGKQGFVETSKWPLYDNDGNIIGVLGISRDITKRIEVDHKIKLHEKNLEKSNATKDKLFSIISHDLRSPFIALMGMNDIISDSIDSKDYDSAKEILKLVEKTSGNALNLLDNLLHWSRIQRGKIALNRVKLNALDLVKEVLGLFQANLEDKHISVSLSIDEEKTINADSFMLQTIIRNLLSNAIKFTNNGGTISIKMESNSKENKFFVSDSGVGIPAENLSRLFDLKRNITTYGTNQEKGSGLGLVLCSEFVKQHKGEIWVENNTNQGASFIFTLKK
ncbi:MAG: PAS domain-containing sensor histidine kinase [Salibacteraceae bacterium]